MVAQILIMTIIGKDIPMMLIPEKKGILQVICQSGSSYKKLPIFFEASTIIALAHKKEVLLKKEKRTILLRG